MTDRRAAEIMYPDQGKDWRIELKSHPIFHRGHAFLALVDGNDRIVGELHGLSFSKHTDQQMTVGMDGADLRALRQGPGSRQLAAKRFSLGNCVMVQGKKSNASGLKVSQSPMPSPRTNSTIKPMTHRTSLAPTAARSRTAIRSPIRFQRLWGWRLKPIAFCRKRTRAAVSRVGSATCSIRTTSVTWRHRSSR